MENLQNHTDFFSKVEELLSSEMGWQILWRIVTIGIAIIFILVVARIVGKIFTRLIAEGETLDPTTQHAKYERFKRLKTFYVLARNTSKIVIYFMGILIIMDMVGIDIKPILAGAGIVGVAVGFGAQSLVKDVISGAFVLFEDQFRVGDVVTAAGISGVVEKVNLRITVLRDLESKVHYIPNGSLGVVTNFTRDFSTAIVDVPIAYKENVDNAIAALKTLYGEFYNSEEWHQKILEPISMLGINEFGESAVMVRALVKTKPGLQWETSRELRRLIKNRLDELRIEIPYPHMKIFFENDEKTLIKEATKK